MIGEDPRSPCTVCGHSRDDGSLGARCSNCYATVGADGRPEMNFESRRGPEGLGIKVSLSPEFRRQLHIRGVVGAGSAGMVFRALHQETKRIVAVKILMRSEPQARQRFLREARILARLSNAHVLRIFDVGEVGGCPYLVTEFLEGGNLRDRLPPGERMSPDAAVRIAVELLDGLETCHRAGIIHRDLKPANIMFQGDRSILADFGLAHLDEEGPALTQAGAVIGTPRYFAPEIIKGAPASPRSDLYSLGLILHEMLAGTHPFPTNDLAELVRHHVTQAPTPLESLVAGIPEGVAACVTQLLAKDPGARPGSATEARLALEAALPSASMPPRPVGPSTPAAPATRIPMTVTPVPLVVPAVRQAPAPIWGSAALLLGAGFLAGSLLTLGLRLPPRSKGPPLVPGPVPSMRASPSPVQAHSPSLAPSPAPVAGILIGEGRYRWYPLADSDPTPDRDPPNRKMIPLPRAMAVDSIAFVIDVDTRRGLLGRYYVGEHNFNCHPIDISSGLEVKHEIRPFLSLLPCDETDKLDIGRTAPIAASWDGYFVAPSSGPFNFELLHDSCGFAAIDHDSNGVFTGAEIICNAEDGIHGPRDPLVLIEGTPYRIRVAFENGGGNNCLDFRYSAPTGPFMSTVPSSLLRPPEPKVRIGSVTLQRGGQTVAREDPGHVLGGMGGLGERTRVTRFRGTVADAVMLDFTDLDQTTDARFAVVLYTKPGPGKN